jgi:DNA-binding transcriptional regulator YiaG
MGRGRSSRRSAAERVIDALAAQPDGLAHIIASVRRGLGLSQGAFGEVVGVSRNTLMTYGHGQTPGRRCSFGWRGPAG